MVYQFKLDVVSGHLLFHKCLYGDKMTKNIHGISVAILAVFLTEMIMRFVLCEQRCNSTRKCNSGTRCCFGTMVSRSNCTIKSIKSSASRTLTSCLRPKCCNEKKNRCSKGACHKNDDPYWQLWFMERLLSLRCYFWAFVCIPFVLPFRVFLSRMLNFSLYVLRISGFTH